MAQTFYACLTRVGLRFVAEDGWKKDGSLDGNGNHGQLCCGLLSSDNSLLVYYHVKSLLTHQRLNKHWWFSGKIGRCHLIDPHQIRENVGQPRVRFPADAITFLHFLFALVLHALANRC